MRLTLLILAQAVEDVLRFELGLPIRGADPSEAEDIYYDALEFLSRYPTLVKRLKGNKFQWLVEVENAKSESIC